MAARKATKKTAKAGARKASAKAAAETPANKATRTGTKAAVAARKTVAPKKKAARARRPLRRKPETLRLRSVMPSLTANDLERSLKFYVDALGFVVGERWTSDSGKLLGVMLNAGTCHLGLAQDDWAKGRKRVKGVGMRIYLETRQDIDALAARIEAAGATMTDPPTDQPWGGRALSIDDPDGFHITVFRD